MPSSSPAQGKHYSSYVLTTVILVTIVLSVSHCTQSESSTPMESTPQIEVREDLGRLRKYVDLPPGNHRCRWTIGPVVATSSRFAVGPSDYSISAFVQLEADAWAALGVDTAPDATGHHKLVAVHLAQALLPPAHLPSKQSGDANYVKLAGVPFGPALSWGRMPYRVSSAFRLGDGLWLGLETR
jgi:hypothetical protein